MPEETSKIILQDQQYTIHVIRERVGSNHDGEELFVGTCKEKEGAISQARTSEELLSNMADAIMLLEGKIGVEPAGFWIKRTIKRNDEFPPNSWQACVKLLESKDYRLKAETLKHKNFSRRANIVGGKGAYIGLLSSLVVPVQDDLSISVIEFYRQKLAKR